MKILKNLNPEGNYFTKSLLYAIGLGGLLHFCALFVIAVKEHNSIWFNPLFAIDFEKVFPRLENNWLTFFGGWLLLGVTTWCIFKLIRHKDSPGD